MSHAVAIVGVPQHYAWGSPTTIPALLGERPDGRPVAELWFGDRPGSASPVPACGTTLDQLVAEDPIGTLGSSAVEHFGQRLPFLLKILAADKALSIQVHPTLEQARAGYAAEDAAQIPIEASHRNYRDANHKPELLCALTPFDGLCGFRPVAETRSIVRELALPELAFLQAELQKSDPLRAAFTAVLSAPDAAAAVDAVSRRAADVTDGPLYAARMVSRDNEGDVGILLSLLLNYVHLEPGEGIYLGAGNVHAYLHGTAVEIMANSDNVLRCGVTPKHVDIPELLRVADFTELADPRVRPSTGGRFDVPATDFELSRVTVNGATAVHDRGPQIILCTAGTVRVEEVDLGPGRAAFVPAGSSAKITGDGVVFVASSGDWST